MMLIAWKSWTEVEPIHGDKTKGKTENISIIVILFVFSVGNFEDLSWLIIYLNTEYTVKVNLTLAFETILYIVYHRQTHIPQQ